MSNERPIIFSSDMVRAILSGAKTQTRRIVKPQPSGGLRWNAVVVNGHGGWTDIHGEPVRCPYGARGWRLWVREAWRVNGNEHDYANATRDSVFYRADEPWNTNAGWKPSIHMPRWASRLTLEITGVRVERLQDITHRDILAEGIGDVYKAPEQLRPMFACLWDSINAKRGYPWASNPLVWAIEFRRLQR